jgi:hypothetical protein
VNAQKLLEPVQIVYVDEKISDLVGLRKYVEKNFSCSSTGGDLPIETLPGFSTEENVAEYSTDIQPTYDKVCVGGTFDRYMQILQTYTVYSFKIYL